MDEGTRRFDALLKDFRKVQHALEKTNWEVPISFVLEYCEIVRRWGLSDSSAKNVTLADIGAALMTDSD